MRLCQDCANCSESCDALCRSEGLEWECLSSRAANGHLGALRVTLAASAASCAVSKWLVARKGVGNDVESQYTARGR